MSLQTFTPVVAGLPRNLRHSECSEESFFLYTFLAFRPRRVAFCQKRQKVIKKRSFPPNFSPASECLHGEASLVRQIRRGNAWQKWKVT